MSSIYPCHNHEFKQARPSIIGISPECAINASKGDLRSILKTTSRCFEGSSSQDVIAEGLRVVTRKGTSPTKGLFVNQTNGSKYDFEASRFQNPVFHVNDCENHYMKRIRRKYPERRILKCSKVKRDFSFGNKLDLCSIAKVKIFGGEVPRLTAWDGFSTRKNLNGESSEYPPRKILKGDGVLIEKNSNVSSVSSEYPPCKILKGLKVKRDCLLGCIDENVCSIIKYSVFSNRVLCLTTNDSGVNKKYSNVGSGPLEDLKVDNNYGATWEVEYRKWCDRGIHYKVKATIELFRAILLKVQQENKDKPIIERCCSYTTAANVLKRNKRWLNTNKCLGCVPGVEIDDEFKSKMELKIVGLHHRRFCGIDYLSRDGVTLATSVVATSRYANEMQASDVLVYIGEGGNPRIRNISPIEDQKLERGNLALKNSFKHKMPVRVIRRKDGHQQKDAKCVYVYKGLYLVETYWQDRGEFGRLVFKFLLRKVSVQQKMFEHVTSVSKNILNDYEGELPISAKLAEDIKRSPYLGSENKTSGGCDCVDGCSESEDCSCKVKNGGKMPYDYDECLVRKMPLIYECGPSCKCSLSCVNRVSQRGTRVALELHKNNVSMYGVRSKSYIRKGSFICKYMAREGFLGKAKQEEIYDLPIDMSRYANVGRFINNSNSPNLYGQRIIGGHEDEPHMMLFAMRNISQSEELTIGYKNQILNS